MPPKVIPTTVTALGLVGNINQLKSESTYSKISLRTEVKNPEYINTYKRYRRYKKSY